MQRSGPGIPSMGSGEPRAARPLRRPTGVVLRDGRAVVRPTRSMVFFGGFLLLVTVPAALAQGESGARAAVAIGGVLVTVLFLFLMSRTSRCEISRDGIVVSASWNGDRVRERVVTDGAATRILIGPVGSRGAMQVRADHQPSGTWPPALRPGGTLLGITLRLGMPAMLRVLAYAAEQGVWPRNTSLDLLAYPQRPRSRRMVRRLEAAGVRVTRNAILQRNPDRPTRARPHVDGG